MPTTYDAGLPVPRLPASGRAPDCDRNLRTQIAWGGAGFLLGVIVWHFVGFWSFVSTIVFRGPAEPGTSTAATHQPTARAAAKRSETVLGKAPTQAAVASPSTECSALVLDRKAGTTALAACDAAASPLHVLHRTQRGDRFVVADHPSTDWSVVVDAGSDATADSMIEPRLDARLGQTGIRLD